MSKLKALLLTEGLHGMISQTEGLAKALDFDYIHEKIELNNFWKLIPPKFTPVKRFIFKNSIKENFDVIISCGRKSVIPSIFLVEFFLRYNEGMTLFLPQEITKSISGTLNFLKNKFEIGVIFGGKSFANMFISTFW